MIKFIWTRGGAGAETGLIGLAASAAGIALHKCPSSSENSVSMDPSNSEEEHVSWQQILFVTEIICIILGG